MFKRIRDLREDNDLTQKQLAAALNCSQQGYSNYEYDMHHKSLTLLWCISYWPPVLIRYSEIEFGSILCSFSSLTEALTSFAAS